MKYLLCGINAKYIHSNLAVYSLKKYADLRGPESAQIQITEYTINHYVDDILRGLYLEKVPMYGFFLKRQYLRQQQGILDFSC